MRSDIRVKSKSWSHLVELEWVFALLFWTGSPCQRSLSWTLHRSVELLIVRLRLRTWLSQQALLPGWLSWLSPYRCREIQSRSEFLFWPIAPCLSFPLAACLKGCVRDRNKRLFPMCGESLLKTYCDFKSLDVLRKIQLGSFHMRWLESPFFRQREVNAWSKFLGQVTRTENIRVRDIHTCVRRRGAKECGERQEGESEAMSTLIFLHQNTYSHLLSSC